MDGPFSQFNEFDLGLVFWYAFGSHHWAVSEIRGGVPKKDYSKIEDLRHTMGGLKTAVVILGHKYFRDGNWTKLEPIFSKEPNWTNLNPNTEKMKRTRTLVVVEPESEPLESQNPNWTLCLPRWLSLY